jgi:hypothetical protein
MWERKENDLNRILDCPILLSQHFCTISDMVKFSSFESLLNFYFF